MGREDEGGWLLSRATCLPLCGEGPAATGEWGGRVTGAWRSACTRLMHGHVDADLST